MSNFRIIAALVARVVTGELQDGAYYIRNGMFGGYLDAARNLRSSVRTSEKPSKWLAKQQADHTWSLHDERSGAPLQAGSLAGAAGAAGSSWRLREVPNGDGNAFMLESVASGELLQHDAAGKPQAMLSAVTASSSHWEFFGEGACHDAVEGDACYNDTVWAKDYAINTRPEWYPGLTADSSFADFQAHLHLCYWKRCPMPCTATTQTSCGMVGRFWDGSSCRAPEPDSQCSRAIAWAMDYGIHLRPDWYPSLDASSGELAFQARMYQGQQAGLEEHGCPEPCCHDALPGELCHEETTWAMLYGINLEEFAHVYPPSFTNGTSFAEFQEYLHLCYPERCPLPCTTTSLAADVQEQGWTLHCPDPKHL